MSDADQWLRVSPLSMIHQLFTGLRQLAGNNIGALAGLIAGGWAFASRAPGLALIALVIALVTAMALLVMGWLRFGYQLREDAILVRRGIFTRQRLILNYDRIQTVRIERPLYLRPFGLVRLSIESAGSASQEVHLAGIPGEQASQIRQNALAGQSAVAPEPDSDDTPSPEEQLLLTRSIGDIIRYGISSPIILWGAVALGSLAGAAARRLEEDEQAEAWLDRLQQSVTETMPVVMAWLSLVLLLLLALCLFSIAIALLRYSGYRLKHADDRYTCQAGLITQREQVLRQHKIQHLSLRQNLIARVLGRRHLTCHQIGMNFQEGPEGSRHLTAPALDRADEQRLVQQLYPGADLDSVQFHPVSWRWMLPRLAFWIPLWLALLAVAAINGTSAAGWAAALSTGPVIIGLIRLSWRRYGWAQAGDYLIFRNGLVGINTVIFAPFRAQQVNLTASPLQRRAKLCNLTVRLSSGAFQMPCLSRNDGEMLMDHLLAEMAGSRAPWL